jgi:hypothetical protein
MKPGDGTTSMATRTPLSLTASVTLVLTGRQVEPIASLKIRTSATEPARVTYLCDGGTFLPFRFRRQRPHSASPARMGSSDLLRKFGDVPEDLSGL